jgi:hypothetical protein
MFKPLILSAAITSAVSFVPVKVCAQSAAPSQTTTNQAGIDQDIDLMRRDVRSKKKQLIAANLPCRQNRTLRPHRALSVTQRPSRTNIFVKPTEVLPDARKVVNDAVSGLTSVQRVWNDSHSSGLEVIERMTRTTINPSANQDR